MTSTHKRESRVSMNARNDALFEFESFKKKFLLANKHITKLNSTLSMRIEELNAQISDLYSENLRLRASEIALRAELRREREKTCRVVMDLEGKALLFTQHLSFLRKTHDIPMTISPTPSPPSQTQQQRRVKTEVSPIFPRLSRVPEVPGITEDDEADPSSSPSASRHARKPSHEADCSSEGEDHPAPTMKTKPGVAEDRFVDFSSVDSRHRKPRRRESGLLIRTESLGVTRPCSPLPDGSRHQEGLVDPVDEGEEAEVLDQIVPPPQPTKSKLKDVTNSPQGKKKRERERKALVAVDNIRAVPDVNPPFPRGFATPPRSESPELLPPQVPAEQVPLPVDLDQDLQSGREKRVRKSVNYAEPKLNTKMRKPESEPPLRPSQKTKKRVSAAAVLSTAAATTSTGGSTGGGGGGVSSSSSSSPTTTNTTPPPEETPSPPVDREPAPGTATAIGVSKRDRKPTAPQTQKPYVLDESWEEDEAGDADADEEYLPPGLSVFTGGVNLERRRGHGGGVGGGGGGGGTPAAASARRRTLDV